MRNTINYLKVGAVALALVTLGSCGEDNELPPIDGYNNSDEVAASNLVAQWTFDDTHAEKKSNTEPATTLGGVAFTDGKIGRALELTKGALSYPEIAAINTVDALNNFTVSLWVNIRNNKGVAGGGFTSFFGIMPTETDFWGNIQACAETGHHLPTSDTLKLKNYLQTFPPGGAPRGEDNLAVRNNDPADDAHPNGQTGKFFLGAKDWVHYVMTWEGSTGNFYIYANGESVGGYTKRGTAAGVLKMKVPAKAVFGSMASSDLGFPNATRPDWAPLATASIDDVRVYNAVLSQAEVTALYNLGTAGR